MSRSSAGVALQILGQARRLTYADVDRMLAHPDPAVVRFVHHVLLSVRDDVLLSLRLEQMDGEAVRQ